jgi:DNA-binding ferritin-like protein
MADAIEKQYTTALISVLKDAKRPPITRVNAFRKLNDIYEVIDNLENYPLTNEQLHETLNTIFDKQAVSMDSFDQDEKKLLKKLIENPNTPMDGLEGGKRKRSMRKRSMRKRSMRKRSMKRRSMKRSVKRSMKRSQTKSGSRTYSINCIVGTLTDMLHVVKLHHWRTHDYSVHKATDNLHEALSEQVDSFVEKLLGSKHTRSNLTDLRMRSYNTLPALKQRVEYYKRYLRDMPASLGTDLLNIRDELLGSLNQFSYMLSLH